MEVKLKFNEINVKEEKEKTLVKVLMLKGEKGDTVSAEWGTISGTITEQTDLKNALDSKAKQTDLNNANQNITNLQNNKANVSDVYNKQEINESQYNQDLKINKKPFYFDNISEMKSYDLSVNDVAIINDKNYKIIDTENATSVIMTFNNEKNRYELSGVSSQTGTPSINNPVEFEDTYSNGIYNTTINNKLYTFELTESLKNLNDISDIFWIDIENNQMGIEKNITEIILNGTEVWEAIDNSSYSSDILRFKSTLYSNVYYKGTTAYISSNKLEGVYLGTRTQNGIARQLDVSGINIFIDKSLLETEDIEGFTEFLSENNIIARYRNDVTESNNYNDISLNNGLLAKIIQENNKFPQKSILDYKEYVVDNDWLPAFNQALNEDVKSLYIPKGVYNITDTINITNGMKMYGDGIGQSNIKLVNFGENTNAVIEFDRSDYSSLQDLTISSYIGRIEVMAGVYIHYSNYVYLNNIKIRDINGDGLYLTFLDSGSSSYDCKMNNMEVFNCTGHGYNLNATDLFLNNCIAHSVRKHGFYFTKSNSLLINCKAYWTGKDGDETTGDGFYLETENYSASFPIIQGHKTRMVNCEAQECGRHGFSLINTDSCQLIGCQSDTNGMRCENIIPYGYYLKNNRNLKLIGTVVNQNLVGWTKIPLYFDGGDCNNIELKTQVLEYGTGYYKFFDDLYTVINYNPSNEIYINNYQINKPDYKNDLYSYDNTSGVAEDFSYERIGVSPASSIIDFNNKSQKLNVEYISTSVADNNAKIYQDFNISYENFNKIAMSVLVKNVNLYTRAFIRFRFYNNSNSQISMTHYRLDLYGDDRDKKALQWNTFVLDTDIPTNTAKVRVEMFTSLTSSGVSAQQGGSTWFKDFKLCFYNQ